MSAIPSRPKWLTDDLIEQARRCPWPRSDCPPGRWTFVKTLGITSDKAQRLASHLRTNGITALATEAEPSVVSPEVEAALNQRIAWLEDENKQLRHDRTVAQVLADAMAGAVAQLPALKISGKPPVVAKSDLDDEDVILFVSDPQVGSVVDEEQTGGLGRYNYDEFRIRFDRYRAGVHRILRYHPNRIQTCYLALGGDLVEGTTIFRGQQRQVDLAAVKQVVAVYEHLSQLVADLAETFPAVKVISVSGNHGRIGMKGECAPNDNLDWLAAWFVRERCKLSGITNVEFSLPETWWALFRVRNSLFYLGHGDDFKSWLGIPFYGAERFRSRVRELLRQSFGLEANPDYFLLGHHHQPAEIPGVFLNGCWPGGSEFSLKRLQAGGDPVQWMIGVHDHQGVSWTRKVYLADRRERPPAPIFT